MLNRRDLSLVGVFLIFTVLLCFVPTGFQDREPEGSVHCKARVVQVDNSEVKRLGFILQGFQDVTMKILNGPLKGEVVEGGNQLMGRMDLDKLFKVGDTAFVVVTLGENRDITFVNPQDHYRLGMELMLFALFALLLTIIGGWTGFKALLSFVFSALMIWKILVPSLLKGYDPIWISLAVVAIMTAAIIFLVAGPTLKGLVAFLGAFAGVLCSCLLSRHFTSEFHLHGAVLPFAETLLYSGFGHLNLPKIFSAAVFISASGAVMDLAMDVAASLDEVVRKMPGITFSAAARSGLTVGRAVVGTMTTTLLLAYSGGYITLLMAFMAQGVPVANMANLLYVSAEILKTLVGSFGLVLVAPFTAIIGSYLYTKGRLRFSKNEKEGTELAPTAAIRSSQFSGPG